MWLRRLLSLVFIIVNHCLQGTSFKCPLDLKQCKCIQKNETGFVSCDNVSVKIKQNDILTFQCKKMAKDYFDEIPTLDTSSIKKLYIKNCSMPLNDSLSYFINKLNFTKLESFKFKSIGANKGRTILPSIFDGLQHISSINFISYDDNIEFSSDSITIPSNVTITTNQLNFQVQMASRVVYFSCIGGHQNITLCPNMKVLNNNVDMLQISFCNFANDYSFNDMLGKFNLKNIDCLWLQDINRNTNYSFDNFQELEYLKYLVVRNSIPQYFSLEYIQNLYNLKEINFYNVNLNSSDFTEFKHLDNLKIINNGTVIKITKDTITIDCKDAVYTELDSLTHIKLGNQTKVIITECSIPNNKSLSIIKEIFSINQIESLRIKSVEANKEIQFTSKLFEGLSELQQLFFEFSSAKANSSDLFIHLKNVRKIELYLDENSTIPQNIFATNHNLKSLMIFKGDFYISTKTNKSLEVYCFNDLTMDFSWLPTFDFGTILEVHFTNCEFPINKTLQQIFKSVKLQDVKILKVDCLQTHNNTSHLDAKLFLDFKRLEKLNLNCAGVQNLAKGHLKHLTKLKFLKINIKNIEIPANISSIAPNLKELVLFTDLVDIFIVFNASLKIKCFSTTDDYINDIPTLIIDVKNLLIRECSLPHNKSMAVIMKKLNINIISNLIIDSADVNKQKTLSSEHFAGFEDLKLLQINMNVLNATEDAFQYLRNLELLELNVDILHTSKSLSFFKKLRYFHLYNSKLTIIPEHFLSSKNIKDFAILNNQVALETIDPHLFSQQPNLISVKIRNNFLKIIPEDIFINCSILASVDMSQNRIEVIPKNIFRNHLYLTTLDLSGNLIIELHFNVFSSMITLMKLRLSNNKITEIPE